MLTIKLLGGLSFIIDGESVKPLRSRTASALLVFLACQQRPFTREHLATFFWEDRNESQAAANLRTALKLLRRPFAPYLTITRQTVAFNHESDHEIDALRFANLLEQLPGKRPLTPEAAAQLAAALAHFQGDFMQGFHLPNAPSFEEWQTVQQQQFRRLAEGGLDQLIRYNLANGRYQEGITQADRLLSFNSLHEPTHRHLMELLWRSGQRASALKHYSKLRRLLAEELNVQPTAKTDLLLARIQNARPKPVQNLPPQANRLVGRQSELQSLFDHLHTNSCRLVTILGPGGVGKTRLLVELGKKIAATLPGRFPNGICFVPLSHLDAPQHLVSAITTALNATFSGSEDGLSELIDYLREKELLLLLDNFEHLLEPSHDTDIGLQTIDSILQKAPHVKIAVTSRIRLQLQEEWVYDLPGLPAPPETWQAKTAMTFPAVQLFLQSARRLQHDFMPNVEEIQAIVKICRLLEGLPLTIEMAASWTRQLTCTDILREIETNLDFLSTSMRNIPARHRTLRAVFDHSWQILTAEEAAALRRLSVFRGIITPAAAQAVTRCSAHTLASLANKSLLQRSTQAQTAVYEVHTLQRQYAAEQLNQHPKECHRAKAAHAAFYNAFLRQRIDALKFGGESPVYNEIAAVIDDIRAAWNWTLAKGNLANESQTAESLFYYYWARGWLQEGLVMAAQTVEQIQQRAIDDEKILALAQVWQAEFYGWLGRYDEATRLYKQVADRKPQNNISAETIFTMIGLGRIQYWQGKYEAAQETFRDSLMVARHIEDGYWISLSLSSLATTLAEAEMDYVQAWSLYEESLAISREIGDQFGSARALINMGSVAQEQSRLAEARQLYNESLALYRRIQYQHGIGMALNYLGQVAYLQGDLSLARELILESYDLNREAGNRRAMVDSLKQLGNVARKAGEPTIARRHFQEAIRLAREITAKQLILSVLLEMAVLLQQDGETQDANQLLAFIATHPAAGQELAEAAQNTLTQKTAVLPKKTETQIFSLDAAIGLAFGHKLPVL